MNFFKLKSDLKGHNGSVFAVKKHKDYLFSCGSDVRIWSLQSHECVAVLGGLVGSILCLTIGKGGPNQEDYVYIGCQDTSIKVFQFYSFSIGVDQKKYFF